LNFSSGKADGRAGERLAEKYLEDKGLQLLYKNWTCSLGEIDLIFQDEDFLVFVEVKSRRNLQKGHPLEAITRKKQRKIMQCAMVFLQDHQKENSNLRFDVVAVLLEDKKPHIEWIRGAFEA
jgi:putative endonuclease